MPRTTEELVGGIIELDPDIPIAPFINFANELVTEACGASGYSDTRMQMIETWVAAHAYSGRDNQTRITSESISQNELQSSYSNKTGLGLQYTFWGQQAMILDTKGGLAMLDKQAREGGKRFKFAWVGGHCPTYEERRSQGLY